MSLTGYYLMTKNGETSFDTAQNILAGKQPDGLGFLRSSFRLAENGHQHCLNEWSQKGQIRDQPRSGDSETEQRWRNVMKFGVKT